MKRLSGKKILMVIPKNKFRGEEYREPREVLEREGAVIMVASSSGETSKSMLGLKVKPDVLIGDVKEEDFDGIVFVGGDGAAEYFNDPAAHRLARSFFDHGKLTSAICVAPATLANTGVLKGKEGHVLPFFRGGASFEGRGRDERGRRHGRNDCHCRRSRGGETVRTDAGGGAWFIRSLDRVAYNLFHQRSSP